MIESPTGSGKTIMGLKLVQHLAEQGMNIGWVAHRRELLKQAMGANRDFFGIEGVEYISLFTRQPQQYAHCDVIVVDECQHDASKTATMLHDVIRPKIIIGLSATPYRTDNAQLCFSRVIRDAGIHQLIREGFLAEFKQWIVEDDWTPEVVANTYLQQPEIWGKSVIYFLTKDDAEACNAILEANGVRSGCVVGDKPRDHLLEGFHGDTLDVLTNVMVLTEGFDYPALQTVFVRPSSRGPTVQMAGRGFRIYPGQDSINIVQSRATKYPFTRHARPLEQWQRLHGKWRNVSPKDLAPLFKSQIARVSDAQVALPTFLTKQMGKKNIFASIMGPQK
tara:strand:- start:88966 stop:89970 length:1005 start_codon:yes stop_codon:yes gene_type:complete